MGGQRAPSGWADWRRRQHCRSTLPRRLPSRWHLADAHGVAAELEHVFRGYALCTRQREFQRRNAAPQTDGTGTIRNDAHDGVVGGPGDQAAAAPLRMDEIAELRLGLRSRTQLQEWMAQAGLVVGTTDLLALID